jgi:hypothetical protein
MAEKITRENVIRFWASKYSEVTIDGDSKLKWA